MRTGCITLSTHLTSCLARWATEQESNYSGYVHWPFPLFSPPAIIIYNVPFFSQPKAIANLKDDIAVLARYCEVAKDTDFVRNTAIYQPYGQFYFLYDSEHSQHLIKANGLEEKRIMMTMPVYLLYLSDPRMALMTDLHIQVNTSFRPKRPVEDHFIANYAHGLRQYLAL